MNINFIYAIQKIIYPKLYPDITFLLDLNRLSSKIRINKRNKKRNKFDELSNKKFNIIRKGFLKISKKYNKKIIKINSNQNISFIRKVVLNKTIEYINARS
jgi:thymidylate kinase